MQLLGYEAYITVDGVKLSQYDVELNEAGKTATCWIPSEAGKQFTVTLKPLDVQPFDICFDLFIDGISVPGKALYKNNAQTVVIDDYRTSATTSRPLIFAPLQLTDDDAYLNVNGTKQLGDIILKLSRADIEPCVATRAIIREIPTDNKVHERAKKALVHRVTFGKEIVKQSGPSVTAKRLSVLVSFIFKYRSIEVLRADGIAPLDATRVGTVGRKRKADEGDSLDELKSEDDDEEDDEDMVKLKAQLQKIQTKIEKKSSKSKPKKVKMEPKMRPLIISGEVIDLT